MTTRGAPAVFTAVPRGSPEHPARLAVAPMAAAPARNSRRAMRRWDCCSKTASAGTPRTWASACAAWMRRKRSVRVLRAMIPLSRVVMEFDHRFGGILLPYLTDLDVVVPRTVGIGELHRRVCDEVAGRREQVRRELRILAGRRVL